MTTCGTPTAHTAKTFDLGRSAVVFGCEAVILAQVLREQALTLVAATLAGMATLDVGSGVLLTFWVARATLKTRPPEEWREGEMRGLALKGSGGRQNVGE